MATHEVIDIIDGLPTFAVPLETILAECERGGAVKILSPAQFITEQQTRWWKGVLLPALAKDNGDSKTAWEIKLKLAVLPDLFQPEAVLVGQSAFMLIPSITKLSKKQMGDLIDGSVQQLHEWEFMWVTLPDETLRRL